MWMMVWVLSVSMVMIWMVKIVCDVSLVLFSLVVDLSHNLSSELFHLLGDSCFDSFIDEIGNSVSHVVWDLLKIILKRSVLIRLINWIHDLKVIR